MHGSSPFEIIKLVTDESERSKNRFCLIASLTDNWPEHPKSLARNNIFSCQLRQNSGFDSVKTCHYSDRIMKHGFFSTVTKLLGSRARSGETAFETALRRYGLQNCCDLRGAFLIGLPPGDDTREAVKSVPKDGTRFGFLAAPQQRELIEVFLGSEEASRVTCMNLGTSHHYAEQMRRTAGATRVYDLTDVTALFKGRHLPALRSLSLGDMFMLFNGHALYCRIGDITPIFEAAANLEILDICGAFTLTRPIFHAHLQEFSADIDDIAGTAGSISQETLDHLLASDLPSATSLSVLMEEDPDHSYRLSENLTQLSGMPRLKALVLEGLDPKSQQRLATLQANLSSAV